MIISETLIKFIRTTNPTSQQCRDHIEHLDGAGVDILLRELRDEGEIAFANGRWYVPGHTQRAAPPKKGRKAHPKQTGRRF